MSDVDLNKLQKQLNDPFPESDIEWRVQQSGMAQKPWAMVIPYVTNRAITQRLDDVFGFMFWEDVYRETPRGMLCGITVHCNGRSVTKWDGAEIPRALTDEEIKNGKKQTIDPVKTVLSNSEKRAAVKFGIGRYLYNLETAFANCKVLGSRSECSEYGKYMKIKQSGGVVIHVEWIPPPLESWALPSVEFDSLLEKITKATDIIIMKGAYITAYKYASSFSRGDLVKKAVEVKDAKKIELEKQSKKENNQEEKKIREWLELQVTDEIFSAKNESVLKLAKVRISKGLKEKSLNHDVDIMEMMKVLENYYQKHLTKINNGERL